ncbi:hypothetical protein [Aureibacter tunicatorum]|uniref:LVIVD repeat-containing protein n=1 Tax=Aureibacter tunicatorum TaxID=866807 RepID=A0AAE3XI04_9BACT|nr:hypothetical protein [Aureibacter tunicatorum]MDR6237167.1 hypothetical protein [Aureibacter tunicatorum]BDD06159.1 hypothetical protein AUTU_36420 [Aureibacter tunicatorum]
MKALKLLVLAFGAVTLTSLVRVEPSPPTDIQFVYRPIYQKSKNGLIGLEPPRELKNTGKIYVYENFLLINSVREGIHILDNTNPEAPKNIAFISIAGNVDMAVKDKVLYVDNYDRLLALSFGDDFKMIKLEGMVEGQFGETAHLPPFEAIAYECVDSEQGYVVGWEMVTREEVNSVCYR